MKIYSGNHKVETTEDIVVNHIPLAYFKEKNYTVLPNIKISEKYKGKDINNKVYPYQQFDEADILLFDQYNKKVDGTKYLKRNGNKYYFEPQNSVEFNPYEFRYRVLLAKEDTYKNNINYNISVGSYSLDIAENLISIFNNEKYGKPSNIIINNNSLLPSSMINISLSEADFLFVDDKYLDSIEDSDIEDIINSHTNLWISYDKYNDLIVKDKKDLTYYYQSPEVYDTSIYFPANKDGNVSINVNIEADKFPKSKYEYINLFLDKCPVLLLKKENGAFVIISHSSLINNAAANYKLIYEIMMKVYLNSYFETRERTSYITEEKIDYFVKVYKRFNKYHPEINLNTILYEDNFNDRINFNIVSVRFDTDDNTGSEKTGLQYLGQDKKGCLLFKKSSTLDPIKDRNAISVFTTKNTVIFYKEQDNNLYAIEDNLDVIYREINDKQYIVIKPFRSTEKSICLEKEQIIEVPDTSSYKLVFDRASDKFLLISYNKNNQDVAAHIRITYKSKLSCSDIRTVGGGEASSTPNYDMIDTGSLKGRAYRIGSTMIIRLPLRYKKHKDNLMSEIKKHMSSADYPILIFE